MHMVQWLVRGPLTRRQGSHRQQTCYGRNIIDEFCYSIGCIQLGCRQECRRYYLWEDFWQMVEGRTSHSPSVSRLKKYHHFMTVSRVHFCFCSLKMWFLCLKMIEKEHKQLLVFLQFFSYGRTSSPGLIRCLYRNKHFVTVLSL